ncbi:Ig domain-containing protein [Caldimonas brevitalea]|nr:Ig domain-containing protein [Caldimonas brevitalea]
MVPLSLAACGGGGSGGDLEVDFQYPSSGQTRVLQPTMIEAELHGLEGNSPRCEVAMGRLPAGMWVDRRSCHIQGTPTEVGSFDVSIELTVPDYEGELWQSVSIYVSGFQVLYWVNNGSNLQWGQSLEVKPELSGYTPAAGETITYSMVGELPAGLALDAATGVISGRLMQVGEFKPRVKATLQRDGQSWSTTSRDIEMQVRGPVVAAAESYFYLGSAVSTSVILQAPPEGASYTLALAPVGDCPAAPPPGLTFDAATGQLSGTPTTMGTHCMGVSVSISVDGQTAQYGQGVMFLVN